MKTRCSILSGADADLKPVEQTGALIVPLKDITEPLITSTRVDEKITSSMLASQIWLPAVQTEAGLPDPTTLTPGTNYLCRVIKDPATSNNGVWQRIANTEHWTYFSDNSDFVDETELEVAMQSKQDTLIGDASNPNQNIKTLGGVNILGKGNIPVMISNRGLLTGTSVWSIAQIPVSNFDTKYGFFQLRTAGDTVVTECTFSLARKYNTNTGIININYTVSEQTIGFTIDANNFTLKAESRGDNTRYMYWYI